MYVYIIECDCGNYVNNPLKIGVAEDPKNRISQLQTGNPFRLKLITQIPCDSRKQAEYIERELHYQFRKFHMHGEWFKGGGVKLSKALAKININKTPKSLKKESLFGSKMKTQAVNAEKRNKKLREQLKQMEIDIEDKLDLIHLSHIK
jgi:predicted GIY-YIG superfamily endonuclease